MWEGMWSEKGRKDRQGELEEKKNIIINHLA
jgi:hypothetical protein